MGYLTKMNGEYGQNGFSAVGFSILGQAPRQGLSRHEAIHAIGAVLSEDMFDIIKNKQEHNFKKYRRRLDKLTAKRWRKGKW